jgi:hypothetical protein
VIFGEVVDGMSVVSVIEGSLTGENNKPYEDILVYDCGELELVKKGTRCTDISEYFIRIPPTIAYIYFGYCFMTVYSRSEIFVSRVENPFMNELIGD